MVDDESRMRKLVRDFLVKQNFEVLEAGDGEEALDVFYKKRYCIDYSGCYDAEDGRMGCMPGNQESSKTPIIMLTAKSEESDELWDLNLEWMNISPNRSARRFWLQE